MPLGPVITDVTNYGGSIRKEVVEKTSHIFKSEYLGELLRLFELAGRDPLKEPVFVLAFGNKETDAMAYAAAGVPRVLTFIIDSRSVIRTAAGFAKELVSYDDAALFEWIDDMISLFLDGKLPVAPSSAGATAATSDAFANQMAYTGGVA